jgi:hypothetical protein
LSHLALSTLGSWGFGDRLWTSPRKFVPPIDFERRGWPDPENSGTVGTKGGKGTRGKQTKSREIRENQRADLLLTIVDDWVSKFPSFQVSRALRSSTSQVGVSEKKVTGPCTYTNDTAVRGFGGSDSTIVRGDVVCGLNGLDGFDGFDGFASSIICALISTLCVTLIAMQCVASIAPIAPLSIALIIALYIASMAPLCVASMASFCALCGFDSSGSTIICGLNDSTVHRFDATSVWL